VPLLNRRLREVMSKIYDYYWITAVDLVDKVEFIEERYKII
jgi:hypothetical protein